MIKSLKTGFSFGLTSGVITTLGLLVGLAASTDSKLAVIGGILTIAIADALSDSLGMHVSQEYQQNKNTKYLWESAFSTFVTKLLTALTFIIPVLYLGLFQAVVVSVVWGLSLLGILSYSIAKEQKEKPIQVVAEHISVGVVVIVSTALLGKFISQYFK